MRLKPTQRDVHEFYARTHRYFWLPCPLCGEEFGGHEWQDIDGKPSAIFREPEAPNKGTGICPKCTAAGLGDMAYGQPYSPE